MDPSRYADLFRTESREQLAALNRALLALEQGEAMREPVDAIFRGVHTIKGMSATMGYSAVAEFSHELESLLDRVRTGEQGLTAELMDALFAAADALEDGIEGAREDDAMSPEMKRVLERLHDVAGGRATSEFRVSSPSDGFRVTSEHTVPPRVPESSMPESAVPGAAVPEAAASAPAAPAGPTATVRVVQAATTLLPGVRAFMVIQRLRAFGEITASAPTVEALQAATTPQRFTVSLATTAGPAELEQAVRSAGDVDEVTVALSAMVQPAVAATTDAPVAARSSPPFNRRAGDASPSYGRRAGDAVEADDLATTAERASPVASRTRHVRIELSRLDALLDLIGELVIVRGRLNALTRALALPALQEAMNDATRLISDLQTEIMTSRLVPVGQVFDRFPRLVRDIARQLGKDVLLQIEGKEIELDRSVLDEIAEPVVHLLRNAVDHGLEMPDVREAQGKPRAGRLTLAAQRDRSAVLVTVRDDGKGIDRARVLQRALELGMVEATTSRLDDEAMLRCIAHPGFSTAEVVTDVSGRGVGVDAVQSRVRALGGSIEVLTTAGVGTLMTIRLPVTLAIVRALLARVGGERYALPLTHVRETMERMPATIRRMQGREVLVLRDEVLPVLRLREVVQLPPGEESGLEEIVVIERGDRRAGLVVDELTGQEDIVVKTYDAVRDGTALFSGATILSDGAPALIVDVGSLL